MAVSLFVSLCWGERNAACATPEHTYTHTCVSDVHGLTESRRDYKWTSACITDTLRKSSKRMGPDLRYSYLNHGAQGIPVH